MYFPGTPTPGQRVAQEYITAALRDTIAEDYAVLQKTQTAVASGAKKHFYYQAHEALCRHQINTVIEWVQSDTRDSHA